MGIYYATREAGEDLLPFFRRVLTDAHGIVRDLALIDDTCYVASEREGGEVVAQIVKSWGDDLPTVHYLPERHVTNFRYDVSGEHSYPYFLWEKHTHCPRRILEQLSPATEPGAQAWRRACYTRTARESAARLAEALSGKENITDLSTCADTLAWSDYMLSEHLTHLWTAITDTAEGELEQVLPLISRVILSAVRSALPGLHVEPTLTTLAARNYLACITRLRNQVARRK